MKFPRPKLISFRDEIEEVPNTGYLTHALYYHPAKFIPQVVRYCLNNYCKEGGVILDPFAGSGTVGLEASINGYKAYLIDINPLLDYFYTIKIPKFSLNEWSKIYRKISNKLEEIIMPSSKPKGNKIKLDIETLEYWYPTDLLNYFVSVWNKFHSLPSKKQNEKIIKSTIALIMFKTSKKYSYAEHSMPKLFTSKRKRKYINSLKRGKILFNKIKREALKELNKINRSITQTLSSYKVKGTEYFSGVDAYEFNYKKIDPVNCIITSPPYLQAQEYIRTFKLEMMWLGYSKNKIRDFARKEIPFRPNMGIIHGNYIDKLRDKNKRKDLLEIFDSYFWFTIKSIERACKALKRSGKLCVFVGNPVMNRVNVEIWKVVYEYFTTNLNYKFISIFKDRIVQRKLFKGRNNINPSGMKSEFLLVLKK